MINTLKKLFSPKAAPAKRRPTIGAPSKPIYGVARVRSLGSGDRATRSVALAAQQNVGHADAMFGATLNALDAFERRPHLAQLPWAKVHMVCVTFAPGTPRQAAASKLPIGMRGTQLGAAATVRGHKGHLHAYALVYLA